MSTDSRDLYTDNEKIEDLIGCFKNYAFSDIHFNESRIISAFILCSCLIDQLASFAYDSEEYNETNYEKFISDYLPQYERRRLYRNLRCKIVHNYTLSPHLALAKDRPQIYSNSTYHDSSTLYLTEFISELEVAFNSFSTDLRNNTLVRKNALLRYPKCKPIIETDKRTWHYSENEADYLIIYYRPILVNRPLNMDFDLRITDVVKEKIGEDLFTVKCVSIPSHNKEHSVFLHLITNQQKIIYPIDVLKQSGQFE